MTVEHSDPATTKTKSRRASSQKQQQKIWQEMICQLQGLIRHYTTSKAHTHAQCYTICDNKGIISPRWTSSTQTQLQTHTKGFGGLGKGRKRTNFHTSSTNSTCICTHIHTAGAKLSSFDTTSTSGGGGGGGKSLFGAAVYIDHIKQKTAYIPHPSWVRYMKEKKKKKKRISIWLYYIIILLRRPIVTQDYKTKTTHFIHVYSHLCVQQTTLHARVHRLPCPIEHRQQDCLKCICIKNQCMSPKANYFTVEPCSRKFTSHGQAGWHALYNSACTSTAEVQSKAWFTIWRWALGAVSRRVNFRTSGKTLS